MGTRTNVMTDGTARDDFIEGCLAMSDLSTGLTALDVHNWARTRVPNWSMRGDGAVELSWWDYFALWHYVTMALPTVGRGSNRAHGGPVFLPWHRMYLIRLEEVIQQLIAKPDFALPYWDWADDRQLSSPLWQTGRLGRNRGAVTAGRIGGIRKRLTGRRTAALGDFLEAHTPEPIVRAAGLDALASQLPRKNDVVACLAELDYDESTWDVDADGFRNHVEGWAGTGPELHNLVHVWVGGDMGPGTSPNDPVFYLNHCNVDRIWEAWMQRRIGGRPYAPDGTFAGGDVPGHNANDLMVALYGDSLRPSDVLDPSPWYDYDDLLVEQ